MAKGCTRERGMYDDDDDDEGPDREIGGGSRATVCRPTRPTGNAGPSLRAVANKGIRKRKKNPS